MTTPLEINIDGACRGNPGKAAIGVVISREQKTIKEISEAIGEATNNIAEYTALIYALKEAQNFKAEELKISTDSELLYKQVTGQYKVKHKNIKPLFEEVQRLAQSFKHIDIKHVAREKNQAADKLANKALDKERAEVIAPTFQISKD